MHKSVKVSKRQSVNAYAVILVGGKGKRLRPLSTDKRPKAFLSVTADKKTMFRVTLDRIKKIIPAPHILVAANKAHVRLVRKDFPSIKKENLISEPVSRNTAPAIALAARILKERNKGAVVVVLPADQYILDERKYLDAVKSGVEFATNNKALIVLGLKPTYPATGFGYIKTVAGRSSLVAGIYKVEKFTEKPDLKTAKKFLEDGRYLWNAGAFVFRAADMLDAVKKNAPEIFSKLAKITAKNINRTYKTFPDISIDYAVMEKSDNIYCVRGSYRWKDIGSFEALEEALRREGRKFIKRDGKIVRIL